MARSSVRIATPPLRVEACRSLHSRRPLWPRVRLTPVLLITILLSGCTAFDDEDEDPAPAMTNSTASTWSGRNLTLNPSGPDNDSAIFFYDAGRPTGRSILWHDSEDSFQMNADVQVIGNLSGTHHVGTLTPLTFPDGSLITVTTAATEGIEATVFARGSARLENGSASVPMPPAFIALVGNGPITAQVTATSDGPALFVPVKEARGIVVVASGGVAADTSFDWFVQATRKGSEDFAP